MADNGTERTRKGVREKLHKVVEEWKEANKENGKADKVHVRVVGDRIVVSKKVD